MIAARCAAVAILALFAGAALAQDKPPNDENRILEESAKKDEGTTSAPPPDEEEQQIVYSGMGLTRVNSKFDNLKEAINLGFLLGFRIPTIPWFALELDIQQTVIPGQNKGPPSGGGVTGGGGGTPCVIPGVPAGCTTGGGGGGGSAAQGNNTTDPDDFAMNAVGVFAALKSQGKFYGFGRIGYRYLATSIDELNLDRSGTAFGGGIGYHWSSTLSGVELGYHKWSKDLTFIGLTFSTGFRR